MRAECLSSFIFRCLWHLSLANTFHGWPAPRSMPNLTTQKKMLVIFPPPGACVDILYSAGCPERLLRAYRLCGVAGNALRSISNGLVQRAVLHRVCDSLVCDNGICHPYVILLNPWKIVLKERA